MAEGGGALMTCQVAGGHLAAYSCQIVARLVFWSFLVTIKVLCSSVKSCTMVQRSSYVVTMIVYSKDKKQAAKATTPDLC